MKKIISFILCLIMRLFISGCSNYKPSNLEELREYIHSGDYNFTMTKEVCNKSINRVVSKDVCLFSGFNSYVSKYELSHYHEDCDLELTDSYYYDFTDNYDIYLKEKDSSFKILQTYKSMDWDKFIESKNTIFDTFDNYFIKQTSKNEYLFYEVDKFIYQILALDLDLFTKEGEVYKYTSLNLHNDFQEVVLDFSNRNNIKMTFDLNYEFSSKKYIYDYTFSNFSNTKIDDVSLDKEETGNLNYIYDKQLDGYILSSCFSKDEVITVDETYDDNVHGIKKVVLIADEAFATNITVKKVILPDSLYEIGNKAFLDCYSLEEINIPKSVKVFNYYIFANNINLVDIKLDESMYEEALDNHIFVNCYKLEQMGFLDKLN